MLSVIRYQSPSTLLNCSKSSYLLLRLPSSSSSIRYSATTNSREEKNKNESTIIWRNKLSAAGLVAAAPKSTQPYLRLMRADKPIGTWLLYWPCTWSIALAATPGCLPDLKLLAIFGTGAFLMRSAGCIINDLWDKDFDRNVERCATRPLASGELNTKQAIALLGGLLSASLGCLLQLNLTTIAFGFTAMIPTILYPLAKRFTNWPQVVLGATFNYGAIMGYTAVTNSFIPEAILPLYISTIFWTLVYDTIYAHQDKEDDIKIGVKSTALRLGDQTKPWLTAFSIGMITNLGIAGAVTNQTWPFFLAVAATSCHLGWQLSTLKINDRQDCWNKFASNQWIGLMIFSGIVIDKLTCTDAKMSRIGQLCCGLSMFTPSDAPEASKIIIQRRDASLFDGWQDEGIYDKVLVDEPCTTDRIAVSQDDGNLFEYGMIQTRLNLLQLQVKLLVNALRSLDAGGTVVYSTRSL